MIGGGIGEQIEIDANEDMHRRTPWLLTCINDHKYIHVHACSNDWQVAACMIIATSPACCVVKRTLEGRERFVQYATPHF